MEDIFTFAGCPVLGQPGDDTDIDYLNPCEACNREDTVVSFLDYSFDGWDGEQIVTHNNLYAVTVPLRDALSAAGLKGISFRRMKATKSSRFAEFSPDPEAELPEFWQLVIESKLDPKALSPSGWWERKGACPKCGRAFWDHTDRVGEGLMAAVMGQVGPPREVARAAWDGGDIFYHEDPGPPLVTRRAKEVFDKLRVKGVAFHPARWV